MARAKLILADTVKAAHAFAREMDFERFSYRAVQRAAAIRGVRNAEVYVLESFLGRRDRYPILHELRFARVEVFYFDDLAESEPADASSPVAVVEGEPDPAVESFFDDAPEVPETLPEPEPRVDDLIKRLDEGSRAAAEEVPTAPKPRVRRKRCGVCEDLIEPDEYDEHVASHKAKVAATPSAAGMF